MDLAAVGFLGRPVALRLNASTSLSGIKRSAVLGAFSAGRRPSSTHCHTRVWLTPSISAADRSDTQGCPWLFHSTAALRTRFTGMCYAFPFPHRARAALRAAARRSSRVAARQRVSAAFFADALRSSGVSARRRALPPWLATQRT